VLHLPGVTFCDPRLLECPPSPTKEGQQREHHPPCCPAHEPARHQPPARRVRAAHGRIEGNKHVLDRNESRKLIAALTEELRLAKRALDKGGVTVVEGDDTVITTYNLQSTPAKRNHGHSHSHGAPSHV
jgi:hypothetical protein